MRGDTDFLDDVLIADLGGVSFIALKMFAGPGGSLNNDLLIINFRDSIGDVSPFCAQYAKSNDFPYKEKEFGSIARDYKPFMNYVEYDIEFSDLSYFSRGYFIPEIITSESVFINDPIKPKSRKQGAPYYGRVRGIFVFTDIEKSLAEVFFGHKSNSFLTFRGMIQYSSDFHEIEQRLDKYCSYPHFEDEVVRSSFDIRNDLSLNGENYDKTKISLFPNIKLSIKNPKEKFFSY